MVFCDPWWSSVVFCYPLWSSVVLGGLLWSTVVFCGPLWSSVIFYGPQWSSVVHSSDIRKKLSWVSALYQLKLRWQLRDDIQHISIRSQDSRGRSTQCTAACLHNKGAAHIRLLVQLLNIWMSAFSKKSSVRMRCISPGLEMASRQQTSCWMMLCRREKGYETVTGESGRSARLGGDYGNETWYIGMSDGRLAKCMASAVGWKRLHTLHVGFPVHFASVHLQDSSSSESLDGRSLDSAKSYDAVVFDVLRVTPEEFASQTIHYGLAQRFSSCPSEGAAMCCSHVWNDRVSELASCGWNKKEKHSLAPNVVAFTRRFNQVSFWVVREILTAQTLKIRAEILSHFIKTAKKLLELNNLHSLVSVVSALQSAPIFRLSKTWALISRKDKATFEKLDFLTSKEENYTRMREYIRSLKMTPCIPYLGYVLGRYGYVFIETKHFTHL
ncbi:hypothetical protein P4O66_017244 [Electrophorus voltai]|uniref:Ras-GEF domain-containing protein n=1 Tax=Electrophorus voltai TaxID=2609070 RepID=A0AAD8YTY3_9TELE|nr:hypothetical protein P4O66_017244 [Electrophorus voltai]